MKIRVYPPPPSRTLLTDNRYSNLAFLLQLIIIVNKLTLWKCKMYVMKYCMYIHVSDYFDTYEIIIFTRHGISSTFQPFAVSNFALNYCYVLPSSCHSSCFNSKYSVMSVFDIIFTHVMTLVRKYILFISNEMWKPFKSYFIKFGM